MHSRQDSPKALRWDLLCTHAGSTSNVKIPLLMLRSLLRQVSAATLVDKGPNQREHLALVFSQLGVLLPLTMNTLHICLVVVSVLYGMCGVFQVLIPREVLLLNSGAGNIGSAPDDVDARAAFYHALCGAWFDVTLACSPASLDDALKGLQDILALPGADSYHQIHSYWRVSLVFSWCLSAHVILAHHNPLLHASANFQAHLQR